MLPYDVRGPHEELIEILRGIDVVIAAMNLAGAHDQIPLATAAKAAGVHQFVPNAFATACPPKGVLDIRDMVRFLFRFIRLLAHK